MDKDQGHKLEWGFQAFLGNVFMPGLIAVLALVIWVIASLLSAQNLLSSGTVYPPIVALALVSMLVFAAVSALIANWVTEETFIKDGKIRTKSALGEKIIDLQKIRRVYDDTESFKTVIYYEEGAKEKKHEINELKGDDKQYLLDVIEISSSKKRVGENKN